MSRCTHKTQADHGQPVTAADIRRGLERRYRSGWTVLHEVPNALGWAPSERSVRDRGPHNGDSRRRIDTVAVGMYRSTGHEIIAHEIKLSRADWLTERRNPAKAAAFDGLVSRFYLVCPPQVATVDELPDGWGMMVYHPSRITVKRVADLRSSATANGFTAALIARALKPKRTAKNELPKC